MNISINAEKVFEKSEHPFMIKIVRELEMKENFLNTIN